MTLSPEIFRPIVEATSDSVLSQLQAVDPTITAVHYEYGHYNDVRERLKAKTQTRPQEKFPLIVLFEDMEVETPRPGLAGNMRIPYMLILANSDKSLTREQRRLKTFEPVLYPIFEEFKKQVKRSGLFMIYGPWRPDYILRPHWGDPELYKNNGYLLNDVLDGIELNNLNLITYLEKCK
jgi:hypothetical protein